MIIGRVRADVRVPEKKCPNRSSTRKAGVREIELVEGKRVDLHSGDFRRRSTAERISANRRDGPRARTGANAIYETPRPMAFVLGDLDTRCLAACMHLGTGPRARPLCRVAITVNLLAVNLLARPAPERRPDR